MSAFGAAPAQAPAHRHPHDLVTVALGALLAVVLTVALVTALTTSGSRAAGQTAISHPGRAGAAGLVQAAAVRYIPQEKSFSPALAVATTRGGYSRQDKSYSSAP
jgi:hypothetical protein